MCNVKRERDADVREEDGDTGEMWEVKLGACNTPLTYLGTVTFACTPCGLTLTDTL